ncbi:MAG TPA: hypothetical protein PLU54_07210 [Deltaproteobacteria bacterium]|nr:hypothetical protein [Deltaproteobacteria bacterium]
MERPATTLDMAGIPTEAADAFRPVAEDITTRLPSRISSLTVTGSCLTGDYMPGLSDINSVLVLHKADMAALDTLSSMGNRFRKTRVSCPLVMTEEYIRRSLDVFPVEFLDMKLFHKTVLGTDPFVGLVIDPKPLRLQCERDLKGKLINLQRGYVSCGGKAGEVGALVLEAFPGYFPLLRAMLFIMQAPKDPPAHKTDVLTESEAVFHVSLGGLREILAMKAGAKTSRDQAHVKSLFQELCRITHDLSLAMDTLVL